MKNPAGSILLTGHVPYFLDACRVNLRVASLVETQSLDQLLGERASDSLGKDGDWGVNVDAGLVVPFRFAVLADSLSPVRIPMSLLPSISGSAPANPANMSMPLCST